MKFVVNNLNNKYFQEKNIIFCNNSHFYNFITDVSIKNKVLSEKEFKIILFRMSMCLIKKKIIFF